MPKERRILTILGPKPPESSAKSAKTSKRKPPKNNGKENNAIAAPIPPLDPLLLLVETALNTGPISTTIPQKNIATLNTEAGLTPPKNPLHYRINAILEAVLETVPLPTISLSLDPIFKEYQISDENISDLIKEIINQYELNQNDVFVSNLTPNFLYILTFYKLCTNGKIDNNQLRQELRNSSEFGVLKGADLLGLLNTQYLSLIQSEINRVQNRLKERASEAFSLITQVQTERRVYRNEMDCQNFKDLMESDCISPVKLMKMAIHIDSIEKLSLKQFIEIMRTYCAEELYQKAGSPLPHMFQRQIDNALTFFKEDSTEYESILILQTYCTGLNAVQVNDFGAKFLHGDLASEIEADLFYETAATLVQSWEEQAQQVQQARRDAPLIPLSSPFQPA